MLSVKNLQRRKFRRKTAKEWIQRRAAILCVLLYTVTVPHYSDANPFKKAEKFVRGAGKAAETMVRETGKKIERSGKKTQENVKQIGKDSETVVRSVGQSLKPPLRTAGDIVSGGQTVRDREKAKANAEKEMAEIRNAQAKEMRKAAIEKTSDYIVNAEAELKTLDKELEALKALQKSYSETEDKIKSFYLKLLEIVDVKEIKLENTHKQYASVINHVEQLISLSMMIVNSAELQLDESAHKKMEEISNAFGSFRERDLSLWSYSEDGVEAYEVFYDEIDELGEAINFIHKMVGHKIEVKNNRKIELKEIIEIETKNLSKLREEK